MEADKPHLKITDTKSIGLALLRMLGASVAVVGIVFFGEAHFGEWTSVVAFGVLFLICVDFGIVSFRSFSDNAAARITITDTQITLRPKLYRADRTKTLQLEDLHRISILRRQQRKPVRLHLETQDGTASIGLDRLSHTPDDVVHAIILRLENLGMTVELDQEPKMSFGSVWDVFSNRTPRQDEPLSVADVFEGFDAD